MNLSKYAQAQHDHFYMHHHYSRELWIFNVNVYYYFFTVIWKFQVELYMDKRTQVISHVKYF